MLAWRDIVNLLLLRSIKLAIILHITWMPLERHIHIIFLSRLELLLVDWDLLTWLLKGLLHLRELSIIKVQLLHDLTHLLDLSTRSVILAL